MKIVKNRMEIFVNMAIMLKCLREFIFEKENWDQIVDVIYSEGKKISFETYYT